MAKAGKVWPCQDKVLLGSYLVCKDLLIGRNSKAGQAVSNLECNKAADARGAFQGHLHSKIGNQLYVYTRSDMYLTVYHSQHGM